MTAGVKTDTQPARRERPAATAAYRCGRVRWPPGIAQQSGKRLLQRLKWGIDCLIGQLEGAEMHSDRTMGAQSAMRRDSFGGIHMHRRHQPARLIEVVPPHVSSTEFGKEVGRYPDIALAQPVVVTRNRRDRTVMTSAEEYQRLERRDRLVFAAGELPDDLIEAVRNADMDERHRHLDALIPDWTP